MQKWYNNSTKRYNVTIDLIKKHPPEQPQPHPRKQYSQNTSTRLIPRRYLLQRRLVRVRITLPSPRITLTTTSRIRSHRPLTIIRMSQHRKQDVRHTQLLLEPIPPIPFLLIPPHTACVIAHTRAGLRGCLRGALQLGLDGVVGGRDEDGGEGEPGGDEALEDDFVVVADFERFAENFGHDVVAEFRGEEFVEGYVEEAVGCCEPFGVVCLGLLVSSCQ